MTTFTEHLEATPIYALTEDGKGFLPPLLRAYGHILYLAGRQAESATRRPSVDEIKEEFQHTFRHLNAITSLTLTPEASSALRNAHSAIERALDEVEGWTATQRETNFVSLANYLLHQTVSLDREFIGLRDSDIGSSL